MPFDASHSRDITKKICELSFYEYIKRAWKYIETDEYVDGWHIKAICDHLQALYEGRLPTHRLIINISPRCGKSLLATSLFPTWLWIKAPTYKIFTGSHSDDNRTRDTIRSRDLMSSEWFQYYWGDLIKFKGDQNQKLWYKNLAGGERLSFTTGGGLTGSGGQCILLDDPLDIRDRYSRAIVDQLNDWIGQGLASRLNNKLLDLFVIIMQRLGENDPTGFLINKQPELWTLLCIPFEFDEERRCITPIFTDPRTKEGEIMWQKITPEELVIIKKDQGRDYIGQFQQRPCHLEGNIFNRNSWKYIDSIEGLHFDFYVQSWDTAWEVKKENDYSVCLTFGVIGNKIYLINIFRQKLKYPELKQAIIQLNNFYHPIAICIEDAASGKPAVQEFTRDTMLPIVGVKVAGGAGKEVRATACTPIVDNGLVYLLSTMSELYEFIEELSVFPNGNHDDQVDAFSQGINYTSRNYGGCPISVV